MAVLHDTCNIIKSVVMSWDGTEGVLRFYMFGKDLAWQGLHFSLCAGHQTSTVLKFWVRGRRGFRGSDEEFEGQSMLISD